MVFTWLCHPRCFILHPIFYTIIILFLSLNVTATIITICEDGCDFTGINSGISAANPGDIVEVHSGTYLENVDIAKPIKLRGLDTGRGKPVVDANQQGNAITISADGATVEGFNVTKAVGSEYELLCGIEVGSNDVLIMNNTIFDNQNGVLLRGSNNVTINNNHITRTQYGIRLIAGSNNNSMDKNSVTGSNFGIHLFKSQRNSILDNNVNDNDFGILLEFSENNRIMKNRINSNEIGIAYDSYFRNIQSPNEMNENTNDTVQFVSGTTSMGPQAGFTSLLKHHINSTQ